MSEDSLQTYDRIVLMSMERSERERANSAVFERAEALAAALMDRHASERWEPLRDLILSGLEAGGLRHATNGAALTTAAGELAAAALDARRHT